MITTMKFESPHSHRSPSVHILKIHKTRYRLVYTTLSDNKCHLIFNYYYSINTCSIPTLPTNLCA